MKKSALSSLKVTIRPIICSFVFFFLFTACSSKSSTQNSSGSSSDSSDTTSAATIAELALGGRLFKETRFATNSAMSCATCHASGNTDGGYKIFNDSSQRSSIPEGNDGRLLTIRNSPTLVDATQKRGDILLLHFDGEFITGADLVKATFTGRNFGYQASEKNQALAAIAKIIREDNGSDSLAAATGNLSYADLFLQLTEAYRLDVSTANDEEITDAVAKVVGAFVDSLRFAADENGNNKGTPYYLFLQKNGLPVGPEGGETAVEYARRLRGLIDALSSPTYVTSSDGSFKTHSQDFAFGETELKGLKIFLKEADSTTTSGVGNCLTCHPPPNFRDSPSRFHNTGVAQREFDKLHGDGSFAALSIPDLATRQANPEAYLPPTAAHPNGTGIFLAVPSATDSKTDLGVWNVFGNDDIPLPQDDLTARICRGLETKVSACTLEELFPHSVAAFKTPPLYDLGQSAPYMHNGQFSTLEEAVDHYRTMSDKAQAGQVRNAASALQNIRLSTDDVQALVSFLKSLNEDYE